jgi:murein DD-endopeptidase MepM/ murein hydrolase activator NlpD
MTPGKPIAIALMASMLAAASGARIHPLAALPPGGRTALEAERGPHRIFDESRSPGDGGSGYGWLGGRPAGGLGTGRVGAGTGPGGAPAGSVGSPPAYGTYAWPVRGRVIRGFEDPQTPYGAGHRGIDIASPFGSVMVAAQDGVVAFAGFVGGSLFISINHSDGVRTTYSWLSAVDVRKGDVVRRGESIGATGHGHPEIDTPHLHFGARVGATYIDPMLLLEGDGVVGLIHLAPLG